MPNFEMLPAEFEDLDAHDPLRPAVIVRTWGEVGQRCFAAIQGGPYCIYTLGRGEVTLPVRSSDRPGHLKFFVTSRSDYSILYAALHPYWKQMPSGMAGLEVNAGTSERQLLFTQDLDDMRNYPAKPPQTDQHIFGEASTFWRKHLGKSPLARSATQVCTWLLQQMRPSQNCYTLSSLLARWLIEHDLEATYCDGAATYDDETRGPILVDHSWVEYEGEVIDLSVRHQIAWQSIVKPPPRLGIRDPRFIYERKPGGPNSELEVFWTRFSKPAGIAPFTEASLKRQTKIIQEIVPPRLYRDRSGWIKYIRRWGVLEGTFQWLCKL